MVRTLNEILSKKGSTEFPTMVYYYLGSYIYIYIYQLEKLEQGLRYGILVHYSQK